MTEGMVRARVGAFMRRWRLWVAAGAICFTASFTFAYAGPGTIVNPFSEALDLSFLSCAKASSLVQSQNCGSSQVMGWIGTYGIQPVMNELDRYEVRFGADEFLHRMGHVIGAATLDVEHGDLSKALALCSQAGGGCIHGAVIQYIATKGMSAFLNLHPEYVCANVVPTAYLLCIHGLGHAYMVAENYDLSAALADCDRLEVNGRQKEECASGVFMEMFDAATGLTHEPIPKDLYYSKGDPFFPCTEPLVMSKAEYARACFSQNERMFAGYAYSHNMTLLQACGDAPSDLQSWCAAGVGIGAAETAAVTAIPKICSSSSSIVLRHGCLYAANVLLRQKKGGLRLSAQLCTEMLSADQVVCDPLYVEQLTEGDIQ